MEAVSPSSAGIREGEAGRLVVFHLDDQRYALRLSAVEKIVRIVEITPLPKAPEIVLGVINLHGQIVPVYDLRARFRLPVREGSLSDHLLVARTARRTVGLISDKVAGVIIRSGGEITTAAHISSDLEYIEGVVKLEDGLVFIHDLDTFLSFEEATQLEEAIMPAQDLP
jgi:purine-binding chemotaxis protein CheW